MKTEPKTDPEPEQRETESSAGTPEEKENATAADRAQPGQPDPQAPAEETPAEEVEKYRDLALRSRAELDNYRKRVMREKEDAIRYANTTLFENLIPILDSFELGLEAAQKSGEAGSLLEGLEMVRRQFGDFLRNSGVEAIEAEGAAFDPNLHEAVAMEPNEEVAEGHVIRQLRKGYKLKERLLRPASVFVSKGPASE